MKRKEYILQNDNNIRL